MNKEKELLNKSRYSNCRGFQCERPEEDLLEEKEQYTALLEAREDEDRKKKEEIEYISSQISSIEYALNDHKSRRLALVKPTEDHIKLLQNMEFRGLWYGATVSIGVDGKRPFGNSCTYSDIARILKWELPNDDLSDEQRQKADKLLDELPFVLNKVMQKIKLK